MQCGLMLSHNVIALYGTIAIGCYVVLTTSNVRWPITVMAGGALGAAMAAYFWLPALVLVKLTNASLPERPDVASTITSASDLHLHALYWQQHFVERLGIGGSIAGPDDPMGINLGIAVLIGIVLAAIAVFRPGLSRGQRYRLCICLVSVWHFPVRNVPTDELGACACHLAIRAVSMASVDLHGLFWMPCYCHGVTRIGQVASPSGVGADCSFDGDSYVAGDPESSRLAHGSGNNQTCVALVCPAGDAAAGMEALLPTNTGR